jgi:glycosyltransferase involved in cell wall biosynthesis
MMVKDEEKNLKRCLDALNPILKNNHVELIIVDTGSKDSTVEIAREYTDKVYIHPWDNNFSEIRNITISYAKGKYILIIDADEVIENALLLYDYINDPALKSYNTYILKIKNFDSSGAFTVLPQERVFKNDGSFRYQGSVHNQPVFKKPVLNSDIYIEHYGYLFHDRELREKKFIRTAGILLKELESNPDNPYYRYQLARSYSAHRDKKEAYEEIKKAYELITRDRETTRLFYYIYGTYSTMCLENNDFDETIRSCKEGLKISPEYLDLHYLMATAYSRSGENNDALASYEKYIDLVERYDKLTISADRAVEMYYTGEKWKDTAYSYIANELLNKGEYLNSYNNTIKVQDEKVRIPKLTKVLLKLKKYDELLKLYTKNSENKATSGIIEGIIEAEAMSENNEEKNNIYSAFSNGDGPYFTLNKIRVSKGEKKRGLSEKVMGSIDFSDLPEYYADILTNMEESHRQVIGVLKKLRRTKIKKYIKRMLDNQKNLDLFLEEYLLSEPVRRDDQNGMRVFIAIAYVVLLLKAVEARNAGVDPAEKCHNIFQQYVEKGILYTRALYGQERLRLYYSTLEDQEDRFFIALQYASEACGRGDYKAGIRYIREAAGANTYMACYLKKYKDSLLPDIGDDMSEAFSEVFDNE